MDTLKTWAAAAAMVALASTAQAALVNRGGGLIYDDTLNITWLADWNYAKTQYDISGAQGDADGLMDWTAAKSWTDNLVYGGYDDWRLPTSLNTDGTGPCSALACSGSEMGHMFYNNWGASNASAFSTGTNAANLALFINVQSTFYWSGTAYEPSPLNAWYFFTGFGEQFFGGKDNELYAVAVRPGDVAASVPEPHTLALSLLALCATVVVRRRRPH